MIALCAAAGANADTLVWTGGAGDGKLASAANWDAERSPQSGDALVFGSAEPLVLENNIDGRVALQSITFNAGAGLHKIAGGELNGISSIVNNSTERHEFACRVNFAGALTPAPRNGTEVNFSGGAVASTINLATNAGLKKVMGHITLTNSAWTVYADASLHVKGAGSTLTYTGTMSFQHSGSNNYTGGKIYAEEGTVVTINNVNFGSNVNNGDRQIGFRGDGKFIVKGTFTHIRTHVFKTAADESNYWPWQDNKIVDLRCENYAQTTKDYAVNFYHTKLYIGRGGFQMTSGKSSYIKDNLVTFGSLANWTMSGSTLYLDGDLTVDTQDPDTGAGYQVTFNCVLGGDKTIYKKGAGVLVFQGASSTWTGGVVASNGVVSAYTSTGFGRGNITVCSNAILRTASNHVITNAIAIKCGGKIVTQSGVTLQNLTLEDGAEIFVEANGGAGGVIATNVLSIADGAKIKVASVGSASGATVTILTANEIDLDSFELYGSYGGARLQVVDVEDGLKALQIADCTVGANEWTGGGDGRTFSDVRNWSLGREPVYSENLVFNTPGGGTLVNDSDNVLWCTVSFGAEAGEFVFEGNPFSRVVAMTNLSSSVQTFNNTVSFNGHYIVNAAGTMDFAGGAFATAIDDPGAGKRIIRGKVEIDGDWSLAASWTVTSGSTLAVKNMSCAYGAWLTAEEGAVVKAANYTQKDNGNGKYDFGLKGAGEFNIESFYHERFYVFNQPDKACVRCDFYAAYNNDRDVILKNSRLEIGRLGMKLSRGTSETASATRGEQIYGEAELGALASYSIFSDYAGRSRFIFMENGARLVFDTENPDSGVGHVVTCNVRILDSLETSGVFGRLVKKGAGVLVLKDSRSTYRGGTVISNGVVSAEASNCLGTGLVSVENGGTLEIPAGSFLTNAVSLAAGATFDINVGAGLSPFAGSLAAAPGATVKVAGRLDEDVTLFGTNIVIASSCDAATLGNMAFRNNLEKPSGAAVAGARLQVSGGALVLQVPMAGMKISVR